MSEESSQYPVASSQDEDRRTSLLIKKFSRPEVLAGRTPRFTLGCSKLYLTINEKFGEPVEVFARIGKSGGCQGALLQGLGRVISIALQAGIEPAAIATTLKGIACPEGQPGDQETRLTSCLDAMARELGKENP